MHLKNVKDLCNGLFKCYFKEEIIFLSRKISHERWLNIKLFVFTYTFLSFEEHFQIFKNKNNSFRFVKKKLPDICNFSNFLEESSMPEIYVISFIFNWRSMRAYIYFSNLLKIFWVPGNNFSKNVTIINEYHPVKFHSSLNKNYLPDPHSAIFLEGSSTSKY